jgi:hypothetical protein
MIYGRMTRYLTRPSIQYGLIRYSSHLKRNAVQSSQGSGQISVCLRSDFRRLQKWTSIFGGENNVDQDQGEGLRHVINTSYMYVAVTPY